MSEADDMRLYLRVRVLPDRIEAKTRQLRALIHEARRLGLKDLANDAWDRVITEAQAEARSSGGSIGFGDGKGDV